MPFETYKLMYAIEKQRHFGSAMANNSKNDEKHIYRKIQIKKQRLKNTNSILYLGECIS